MHKKVQICANNFNEEVNIVLLFLRKSFLPINAVPPEACLHELPEQGLRARSVSGGIFGHILPPLVLAAKTDNYPFKTCILFWVLLTSSPCHFKLHFPVANNLNLQKGFSEALFQSTCLWFKSITNSWGKLVAILATTQCWWAGSHDSWQLMVKVLGSVWVFFLKVLQLPAVWADS